MIRWLSQLWVSSAVDRNGTPPRLWRWTFGRLASHRAFASQLRQLDGQLKRQATSQQRAIARESWPIGDYPAKPAVNGDATDNRPTEHFTGWGLGLWRPALAAGLFAVLMAGAWLAWPTSPMQSPEELYLATKQSAARIWTPLSEQAQATGLALRNQTTHVTGLADRLPAIDRVVNNLGTAIETPLREEVRRFAWDMTRPWAHLANQLPRPVIRHDEEKAKKS